MKCSSGEVTLIVAAPRMPHERETPYPGSVESTQTRESEATRIVAAHKHLGYMHPPYPGTTESTQMQ